MFTEMVLLHTAFDINHFSNIRKIVIYRAMDIFLIICWFLYQQEPFLFT